MAVVTDIKQLDFNKKYTYADYLTWQFAERVELLRGYVRRMSPAPSDSHQQVSVNLSAILKNHFKNKKCQVRHAPYDVRLVIPNETIISEKRRKTATIISDVEIQTVVQPDLLVVCDPNKIDRRGCQGAPDLVVEILSEGNNQNDLVEKFSIYESAGVPEYWIVHPHEQTLTIYTYNTHNKYVGSKPYTLNEIIASTTLPGLEIAIDEVFE